MDLGRHFAMTALEKQWEPKRSDTSVSDAEAELFMIEGSLDKNRMPYP
jgi:hypothetical protein